MAKNTNVADDVSSALDKAVHSIYAQHPHECNIILYLGGALLLIMGAYHEYQLVPASVSK